MSIDPRLLKAYRALLGWSQADLAKKAGVGRAAISRMESGDFGTRRSTVGAVVQAFEEEGLAPFPKASVVDVRLLRAARALLGMSQADVAKEAGLGLATVLRLETKWSGNQSTAFAVQKVLEQHGVEFTPECEKKGQGLRLHSKAALALDKEGFTWPSVTTFVDARFLRAARVLLAMSQAELAEEAGLDRNTVVRLESDAAVGYYIISAVLKVFDQEGIDFIPASGTKVHGLRFRHKQPLSMDD